MWQGGNAISSSSPGFHALIMCLRLNGSFISPLIKSIHELADENDKLRQEISIIKAHLGL